jgi:CHAT domain
MSVDSSVNPVVADPVDLQFRVRTRPVQGGLVLDYELTSPSGHLDVLSVKAQSERLNVEALEKEHRRLFSGLEDLLRGLGEDGEILVDGEIEDELQDRGHELYSRLFPEELKTFYRQYRDRVRSLLILSDEPWIPWELVRPDEFDDDDFLCMRFPMARWFDGPHPPAPAIQVRRLLVAEAAEVETYPTLASARLEREMLARLIAEIPSLSGEILESATFAGLRDRLKQGGFDVIHFAGHADYDDGEPERSRLVLTDRPLQASKLTGEILRKVQKDRPLVFLDACRAARKGLALTGIGGWPDRWVRRGRCGALLCPQWAVQDGSAGVFAETFYDRLREGGSLGDTVLAARHRLRERDPADPTYLAYSLYGHPSAGVVFDEKTLPIEAPDKSPRPRSNVPPRTMRRVEKAICLMKARRTDATPVLLTYKSDDWRMSLFPNTNLPREAIDDVSTITSLLSERIGVAPSELTIRFDRRDASRVSRMVKLTADPQKAAKYGPEAEYIFHYAEVSVATPPKHLLARVFRCREITFMWRSLPSLKSDPHVRKHNYDVLEYLSSTYDQTLAAMPDSFPVLIDAGPLDAEDRYDAFICHAHEDKDFVRLLAHALRQTGLAGDLHFELEREPHRLRSSRRGFLERQLSHRLNRRSRRSEEDDQQRHLLPVLGSLDSTSRRARGSGWVATPSVATHDSRWFTARGFGLSFVELSPFPVCRESSDRALPRSPLRSSPGSRR